MIYKCEKCNYTTDKKTSFTKHLNRKTPCKAKTALENNNGDTIIPNVGNDNVKNKNNVNIEIEKNPVRALRLSEDMLIDMMVLYYHSYKMMESKYGEHFVEKEKPNLRRLVDELLKLED